VVAYCNSATIKPTVCSSLRQCKSRMAGLLLGLCDRLNITLQTRHPPPQNDHMPPEIMSVCVQGARCRIIWEVCSCTL